MTPDDKRRYLMAHKALTVAFPDRVGDQDFMALCEVALMPYPIEVVEAVYHSASATPIFGGFSPKPGQLAGLAQEIMDGAGIKSPEAWGHEWFAWIVARFPDLRGPEGNRNHLLSKYDAQAVQAVANCGGLGVMLKGAGDGPRQRFVKAYCKLELNYQDGPPRPVKPVNDMNSPTRGRVLKQAQQQAAIAANEQQSQIEYQGSSRDVVRLMRGLMRP